MRQLPFSQSFRYFTLKIFSFLLSADRNSGFLLVHHSDSLSFKTREKACWNLLIRNFEIREDQEIYFFRRVGVAFYGGSQNFKGEGVIFLEKLITLCTCVKGNLKRTLYCYKIFYGSLLLHFYLIP